MGEIVYNGLWVGLYTRGRVQQTGKQMGGLNILGRTWWPLQK
jgi:hypothetical protein